MSSPIGPGDWVVVATEPNNVTGAVKGGHYLVSEAGEINGYGWLNCHGVKTPAECGLRDDGIGWAIECFRKIDRISDSFRQALLTPVPLDVEPLVASVEASIATPDGSAA